MNKSEVFKNHRDIVPERDYFMEIIRKDDDSFLARSSFIPSGVFIDQLKVSKMLLYGLSPKIHTVYDPDLQFNYKELKKPSKKARKMILRFCPSTLAVEVHTCPTEKILVMS